MVEADPPEAPPEEDAPPEEGPDDDDGRPAPDGMEEPDPPEGDGMGGGVLRPAPPPEGAGEPDEPPLGDGGTGEGMELEDWLAQPPISNADTAPSAVICAATTHSLRHHGNGCDKPCNGSRCGVC